MNDISERLPIEEPPVVLSMKNCSVFLPLKARPAGDFRRDVLKTVLGGEIFQHGRRDRAFVTALNRVTLDIRKGERIGVVGSNGSGKTTFLKTISGAYHPQQGTLDVAGKLVSLLNLGYGLANELSGYENIPNLCVQFGLDIRATQKLIPEIMEFSDLGEFFYQPVKTYSSGMRMRLLLAVATLHAPDILVMDEWFGTGDAAFRVKAEARINSLVDQSGTLILASHNVNLIRKWTQKAIWLNKGHLMAFGPTEDVLKSYTQATTP